VPRPPRCSASGVRHPDATVVRLVLAERP
jgi:hypothetical protein